MAIRLGIGYSECRGDGVELIREARVREYEEID